MRVEDLSYHDETSGRVMVYKIIKFNTGDWVEVHNRKVQFYDNAPEWLRGVAELSGDMLNMAREGMEFRICNVADDSDRKALSLVWR